MSDQAQLEKMLDNATIKVRSSIIGSVLVLVLVSIRIYIIHFIMLLNIMYILNPLQVARMDPTKFVSGLWYERAEVKQYAKDPVVILNNWTVGIPKKVREKEIISLTRID